MCRRSVREVYLIRSLLPVIQGRLSPESDAARLQRRIVMRSMQMIFAFYSGRNSMNGWPSHCLNIFSVYVHPKVIMISPKLITIAPEVIIKTPKVITNSFGQHRSNGGFQVR